MKKIIQSLVFITFLSLLMVPIMAEAQPQQMVTTCTIRSGDTATALPNDCGTLAVGATANYDQFAICCLMDKVFLVTWWIFIFVVSLAIIFILWGGFQIVTAGGSDEKVVTGRKFIMWALIGFAVAILSRALPLIVRFFVS